MAGDSSISAACATAAVSSRLANEDARLDRSSPPSRTPNGWIPDYLVFVRDGILVGQRFELATARVVGEPFSIAEPIDYNYSTARAEFATSRTGNVAYQSHTDTARLTWSDRHGAITGEVGSPGNYQTVRLSPDGGRVLFDRREPRIGTLDLWVLDLVRGGETRLTSDVTSESWPVWLRDGLVWSSWPIAVALRISFAETQSRAPRTHCCQPDDTNGRPMYRQTGRRWPSSRGRRSATTTY